MTATAQAQVQVTRRAGGTLLEAHRQWASRPDDERFLTLEDLLAATEALAAVSTEGILRVGDLLPTAQDEEVVLNGDTLLTHYSFGRVAQLAGAPAGYLRGLPAPLAALNLRYGLRQPAQAKDEDGNPLEVKLLVSQREGTQPRLRALTTPTWGRIWDHQVVRALLDVNERCGGIWRVPTAAYGGELSKRSTTLYASDHDMFAFLVDGERTLEDPSMGRAAINRGFIVWNTEVESRSLGIMTFLFNHVCGNRMIWGAADVLQLLVRHTKGGPARFAQHAPPALTGYAEQSPSAVIATVAEARKFLPTPATEDEPEPAVAWLRERGFSRTQASGGLDVALKGDPQDGIDPQVSPFSLWNMVQGLTAYARDIPFADDRTAVEQRAGDLLTLVAPKA